MNIQKTKELLISIDSKIEENRKLSYLNGESFNIFSILKVENDEEKTHSRFISELLSPTGSHGLGTMFLHHFLNRLPISDGDCKLLVLKNFDLNSISVTVEYHIGRRSYEYVEGGRVDIKISDAKGYSILIENKVYAKDQEKQIERYCNFNTSKSIVLYLTLFGGNPSNKSAGSCKRGRDYYCISYQKYIVSWLESCISNIPNIPTLEEAIKQYLHLVKSLTSQLNNNKMKEEVKSLIFKNLESAKLISDNYYNVKTEMLDNIRAQVKLKLEGIENFSSRYTISTQGSKVGDKNSKLWFHHKSVPDELGVFFGIEPFSGFGNKQNELFIGLIDVGSKREDLFKEYNLEKLGWWRGVEYFTFNNARINLSDAKTLQLISEEKNFDRFITLIVTSSIQYILEVEDILIEISKKAKLLQNNKSS